VNDEQIEILLELRNISAFLRDAHAGERAIKGIGDEGTRTAAKLKRADTSSRLFASGLGILRRGLALTGAGLGTIGAMAVYQGVKFNTSMEQNTQALKFFIGSTKGANEELQFLFDLAAKGPFEFPDLVAANRKMLAFGMSLKDSRRLSLSLNDAVAGIGGGADEMRRITIALGQIQTKNKVFGEELLQLNEAGIPASQYLKRYLHLPDSVMNRIGDLNIDAKTAIGAIIKGMNDQFHGAAEVQNKTLYGQFTTFKDYYRMILGFATQGLSGLIRNMLFGVNRYLYIIINDVRKGFSFNEIAADLDKAAGAQGRLIAIIDKLRRTGIALRDFFVTVWPVFKTLGEVILGVTYVGFLALEPTLSFFNSHGTTTRIIVWGLVTAFVAWRVALVAWNIVAWVTNGRLAMEAALAGKAREMTLAQWIVIKLITAAQWLWNAALAAYRAVVLLVIESDIVLGLIMLKNRAYMIGLTILEWAQVAATTALTVAQWLLNAAMLAFPVILIIAAIVAIVVAVIILYKRWGWFHDKVQMIWGWIKTNWPLLLAILTGPIGLAVYMIIRYWTQIENFIMGFPDRMRGWASTMWDWMIAPLERVLAYIWDKINAVIGAIQWAIDHLNPFGGEAGDPNFASGGRHGRTPVTTAGVRPGKPGQTGARVLGVPVAAGSNLGVDGIGTTYGKMPEYIQTTVQVDGKTIAKAQHKINRDRVARK
jgi:tape measure domain-containing protein